MADWFPPLPPSAWRVTPLIVVAPTMTIVPRAPPPPGASLLLLVPSGFGASPPATPFARMLPPEMVVPAPRYRMTSPPPLPPAPPRLSLESPAPPPPPRKSRLAGLFGTGRPRSRRPNAGCLRPRWCCSVQRDSDPGPEPDWPRCNRRARRPPPPSSSLPGGAGTAPRPTVSSAPGGVVSGRSQAKARPRTAVVAVRAAAAARVVCVATAAAVGGWRRGRRCRVRRSRS